MAKLLVANRSEIACRIFQAARELGLETVAIVAPGDESARHVTMAQAVVEVKSYLDIESIVAAAKKIGATLVHPGYGFLSERAAFAEALEAAGITFVGPRPETIDLMGGKVAAKELCEKNGIPTLPWAKVKAGENLGPIAKKMGYPVLLKAAAGGGGKGMRRVTAEVDLTSAAESASAEAVAAFGDGTLFIEKFVEKPRHIEIQVFGDGVGGGAVLRERECSLQRRHQKVWEEAPAANLSEDTRQGLYAAAINLLKATQYRSAGTLEFLVDEDGKFYFLEMNTRLQVEHPVTELITGVDLVHLQLEQALHPEQKFSAPHLPEPRGHAIEVRLYAEDPSQGFMPSPGEIRALNWPLGAGIRVDSGIEVGQVVSTSFDSMLAKIIVHAPTRQKAMARMQVALEDTVVLGVGTNQAYLLALTRDAQVAKAEVYTQYLEKEFKWTSIPSAPNLEILGQWKQNSRSIGSASGGSPTGVEPSHPAIWSEVAKTWSEGRE